jgi:hypothetical protein
VSDSPFHAHRIGFRRNPFGAYTPSEWKKIALFRADIREAAEGSTAHLQIIAEKGRGKTSTLLGLQASLEEAGQRVEYERLPLGVHHYQIDLNDLNTFCLDEAQRLAPWEIARLIRAARHTRLILGTHRDLRPWFRLKTFSLRASDPAHVREVIGRKLAFCALPDRDHALVSDPALKALIAHFGSDIRAIEGCLYEVFQRLMTPRPVTVADLDPFI